MQKRGEIRALTGVRGLAAMLVVLHHFSPTDKISLWNTFTNHTYLGVDIFFVLSVCPGSFLCLA